MCFGPVRHWRSHSKDVLTSFRATISLYQGLIFPPLEGTPGTWNHAIRRCLEACDSMTNLLQDVLDTDLENMSPLIIQCIFVAARFCIRKPKTFGTDTLADGNCSSCEDIRH